MICRNKESGVNYHTHQTVIEARRCWFPPAAPVPASRPVPPPQVIYPQSVFEPVTENQLGYIRRLNGDMTYAAKLSKEEASRYIDQLKSAGNRPQPKPEDPRLKLIDGMIDMIPDGYYATAKDGPGGHVDFLRISRPQRGRYVGTIKIQTQHSEKWQERMVKWPSGKWSVFSHNAIEILLMVIADHKTCARRYAIEKQHCFMCNLTLTDDKSRHYLVGPVCDKKGPGPAQVAWVDEQNDGLTFEQLVARGKPTRIWQDNLLVS